MEEELSSQFRDLINDFFIKSEFLYDGQVVSKSWSRICICMDILQNTERACISFFSKKENEISYLEIYGFFQSLFLQQKSIEVLFNLIYDKSFRISSIKVLDKISKYRNCYVGHPAKKEGGEFISYGLASYTYDNFKIGTYVWGKKNDYSFIDLKKIDKDQKNEINKLLEIMVKKLEDIKLEKIKKLKKVNINFFEGLFFGSFYNGDLKMAKHHFNTLKKRIQEIISEVILIFGGKLEERYSLDTLFTEINYCLDNFPGFVYSNINNYIYFDFLKNKLEELKLFFKEI